VKAAAPSAPTVALGAAKGGKNRKPHGAAVPSPLVKGMDKGSALFLRLLSARAAAREKAGTPVPAAIAQSASREAGGLKTAALAARANHATVASKVASTAASPVPIAAAVPARLAAAPAAKHSAEVAPHPAKANPAASAPKKKTESADPRSVAVPPAAVPVHAIPVAAVKEPKDRAPEAAKPSSIEPLAVASKPAQPLVRILDLRHNDKQPTESSPTRRLDPVPSQDRDSPSIVVSRPILHEAPPDTSARPAPVSPPPATPLERLRDMAGSELMRASQLVLKDGGGEIRLVLKPESLGSVRVRMNLVDNAIEGRIIVDSSAVKHVLDGSVDALRRALTAEGFQMGSLQVSVGGQEAQSDLRRRQDEAPTEIRRIAARGFERSMPGAEDMSLGDLFVNLFV